MTNFIFSLLFLTLCPVLSAYSQEADAELAFQYMDQKEYEKAVEFFEKALDKQNTAFSRLHEGYLQTLWQLNGYKKAGKYIKDRMKQFPEEPTYQVDYAVNLVYDKDSAQAEKHLEKYLESIVANSPKVQNLAISLVDRGFFAFAVRAYKANEQVSRKSFHRDLAQLYYKWGKKPEAVVELMELLKKDPEEQDYAQVALQDYLSEEAEYTMMERQIYQYIQSNPDKIVFNEMLLWYQLMKKDFDGALFQAKAIDRRKKMGGSKLIEIGDLALNNSNYNVAVKAFEHLVKNYNDRPIYPLARRRLIEAKELLIKNTYPIDYDKLRSLVADYRTMLDELGLRNNTADALRNMALLYAFYLDEREMGIEMLEQLIETPGIPGLLADKAKLDLGDIYLLKDEPWEATLLYSQVEKSQKDKDLGHQAKLKNAKLSYYSGDFELAASHLDILKLATTREIANDAMALSLLITDNLNLDSTEAAMQAYASVDLLLFQGQLEKALEAYKKMLEDFPKHTLTDEILYEMGKIYLTLGRFEEAAKSFREIVEKHGDDILADVANFKLAKVYEENLDDKQTAIDLYLKQLVDFSGSIYNVEARKRLRALRGDKFN